MRRSAEEIAKMRKAGKVVAEMHEATRAAAAPGVTTEQLDKLAREVIERRGARSNFLNYRGFPATICTSPNDMIVHGIPGGYVLERGGHPLDRLRRDRRGLPRRRRLHDGHRRRRTDAARRLLEVTEASLWAGIAQLEAGDACTRWAGRYRKWPRLPASRWSASTWATGSARPCTRIPRFPTTGQARPGPCSRPEWSSRSSPWSTSGAPRPGCWTTAGPW